MSLGCPEPLEPCDYIGIIPSQYQSKPRFMAHVTADIERLCCHSEALASICGAFNCETAIGDQLTMIGESIGWPRTHCNSMVSPIFGYPCDESAPNGYGCPEQFVLGYCEGVTYYCGLLDREDYTFTDDELYRSFIKAKIAKNNSGVTVTDICAVIQALWGEDAFVVNATDGVIGVSAGRDLTPDEQALLSLYNKVICPALGVRLEIYCIAPTGPTCVADVSANCASGDVGSLTVGPFTSPVGDTVALTYSAPSWITPVQNADGTVTLNYSVPVVSVNEMVVITADDCLGSCQTIVTFICDLQGDPMAPPNATIDCGTVTSPQSPIAPADVTIDCGTVSQQPTSPQNLTIDCDGNIL